MPERAHAKLSPREALPQDAARQHAEMGTWPVPSGAPVIRMAASCRPSMTETMLFPRQRRVAADVALTYAHSAMLAAMAAKEDGVL